KRCLNFEKSKILFINYQTENIDFIKKVEAKAYELGVEEVYLRNEEIYKRHDVLKDISLADIETEPLFDNAIWDAYANQNASFLLLESEFPHLMDDVDPEKISKMQIVDRKTKPVYKKKQLEYSIPWCIATIPSIPWAKNMFPELDDKEAYDKLFKLICSMSMVDTRDPIISWNAYFDTQKKTVDKLNDLKITKMVYKNSLGTNLTIYLHESAIWRSAGRSDMIVNCPSFEIFTTPIFNKTEGIVYSSRPLCFNGSFIKDFYFVFKNGKVVDYGAKEGKDLLKGIITSDEYAAYLGEVALVPNNSPISNTGLVYGNTLLDENASCHLALGAGFIDCLRIDKNITLEDMKKYGINPSKNHVDFMIGTPDLGIEVETNKGKILMFKNGEFNI
ncbi:MAG: aminopeptidase, partial [Bacilli bacterium]|nr:aminopeptidase [Bacilli bacterium]